MGTDSSDAEITVVFALPDAADIVTMPYTQGMTAHMAVERSGILGRHSELAHGPTVLGVFGLRVEGSCLLAPGDRVEICRQLHEDPRELRKRLQRDGKVIGDQTPKGPSAS